MGMGMAVRSTPPVNLATMSMPIVAVLLFFSTVAILLALAAAP